MMSSTLIIAVIGIAVIIVYTFLIHVLRRASKVSLGLETSKKSKSTLKELPGPRDWPIVGSAPILAKYAKPWEAFSALRKIYGDVYGIRIGSQQCVVITSFEAIKEVLVYKASDFANRPNFARFEAIFRGHRDRSVALCDWSDKQRTRRDVTFPFTHPRVHTWGLEHLSGCIETLLNDVVTNLKSKSAMDANETLLLASANLFYDFMCGCRFDNSDKKFITAVHQYHLVFCELFRGYSIDFFPWIRHFDDSMLTRLHELSTDVSKFTEPIFQEHEAKLQADNPRDLIDVLLVSEAGLSRHDSLVIIEDLVGGHCALHNMWMWMIFFIAVHSHVAERIRKEVDSINPGRGNLKIEQRSSLLYTEATFNEVLRIVASPIIPHRSTKDTCIQSFAVPQDSLIFFNTFDLHMDPTLWSNPTKFQPERFLEVKKKRVMRPEYFIPFGTGKRSCLGDYIVRSTLLLGIATLVQNFDIEVTKGASLLDIAQLPGTVLWPENDITIEFTSRVLS